MTKKKKEVRTESLAVFKKMEIPERIAYAAARELFEDNLNNLCDDLNSQIEHIKGLLVKAPHLEEGLDANYSQALSVSVENINEGVNNLNKNAWFYIHRLTAKDSKTYISLETVSG